MPFLDDRCWSSPRLKVGFVLRGHGAGDWSDDRYAGHGSARLRDAIGFKLSAKGASIGSLVGPLRITLVLGAGAAQGDAGECGALAFPANACSAAGSGFKCK